MVNVIPKVRQVFQRIESNSLEDLGDDRFNYFKANVLEKLLQREEKHILIFVPSYFDFVRVRNLLMKKVSITCRFDLVPIFQIIVCSYLAFHLLNRRHPS